MLRHSGQQTCLFLHTPAQIHFLHSIATIKALVNTLQNYNTLTDGTVQYLQESIHSVIELIETENHKMKAELIELFGQLWTCLGGNHSCLAHISTWLNTLSTVGNHTILMRAIVWQVRQQLNELKKSTEVLHDIASKPLLISGPLPCSIILCQLSDGCQALQHSLLRFGGPRGRRKENLKLLGSSWYNTYCNNEWPLTFSFSLLPCTRRSVHWCII
jgi:hypothetical protein